MANKAKNSDEMKTVCRRCPLERCVADLPQNYAASCGCSLARIVTGPVWRGSAFYAHEDRYVDPESPTRGLPEYRLHVPDM